MLWRPGFRGAAVFVFFPPIFPVIFWSPLDAGARWSRHRAARFMLMPILYLFWRYQWHEKLP